MNDALYQAEILRLAKDGRGNQRLEDADGSARVDNPLCGDRVTVDLKLPVREFKSRHECVRLPFDAALNALKDALEKKPAF